MVALVIEIPVVSATRRQERLEKTAKRQHRIRSTGIDVPTISQPRSASGRDRDGDTVEVNISTFEPSCHLGGTGSELE